MYELIDYIVKSLVDNKEAVKVEQSKEDRVTVFNVTVDSKDLGQVIGKGGNIAQAIRTIVKSYDSHQRIRIKFDAK